jgi:hypothetical protein
MYTDHDLATFAGMSVAGHQWIDLRRAATWPTERSLRLTPCRDA